MENGAQLITYFWGKKILNPKVRSQILWMQIIPDNVFINRTYKNENNEFLNQSDDSAFKPIRW